MNASGSVVHSAAVRGALGRANLLPPLNLNPDNPQPAEFLAASGWNNNWADWDNSGGHNEWENGNPSPPGG